MNIYKTWVTALSLFILIVSCKKEDTNTLTVNPTQIEFDEEGGFASMTIITNADTWDVLNQSPDWINLSKKTGPKNETLVNIEVNTKTLEPRTSKLTVTAGNAEPVEVAVSQLASTYLYDIECNMLELTFTRGGNSKNLNFSTNAPSWNISCEDDWLTFSDTTGTNGENTITITALQNPSENARDAKVTIAAEHAISHEINITQSGKLYPDYNTSPLPPDETGMTSTAQQLAAKINIGWNIGNTLEAIGGETSWGNPMVSKELIQLVKQSGFNAIRIPCSFNQYMENRTTAKLDGDWLNRVKQVVQYCVDEDMYVLLNIHWDGGWLENNVTTAKQEENNAKQKAFWQQIATHLRNFDEHLLFASANEPNVDNATQMKVLNSYHQTFIDAVRETGGKNTYRVLVVQGPNTDIEKTHTLMTDFPKDGTPNKLMAEIHYYTPWNFCGMTQDESWGDMFFYWGNGYHSDTDPDRNATWGEENLVNELLAKMKNQFVDKGIPVIMGEYSATRRSNLTGDKLTNHLESRAYYHYFITKQAKAYGLLPFYWDNGGTGDFGSGIFDRTSNQVFDQMVLDALIKGANGADYK